MKKYKISVICFILTAFSSCFALEWISQSRAGLWMMDYVPAAAGFLLLAFSADKENTSPIVRLMLILAALGHIGGHIAILCSISNLLPFGLLCLPGHAATAKSCLELRNKCRFEENCSIRSSMIVYICIDIVLFIRICFTLLFAGSLALANIVIFSGSVANILFLLRLIVSIVMLSEW